MNRRTLLDLLVRAERDISRGEQIIARHRLTISEMEREGRDCTRSRQLLASLAKIQEMHLRRLAALRRELEASSRTPKQSV